MHEGHPLQLALKCMFPEIDYVLLTKIIIGCGVFYFSLKQVGFYTTALIVFLFFVSFQWPEAQSGSILVLLFLYWQQTERYEDLASALKKAPHQDYGDNWQNVIIKNDVLEEL